MLKTKNENVKKNIQNTIRYSLILLQLFFKFYFSFNYSSITFLIYHTQIEHLHNVHNIYI